MSEAGSELYEDEGSYYESESQVSYRDQDLPTRGSQQGDFKDPQLWKVADEKAQKAGPHHTVFLMNGSTYKGSWANNKKSGPGKQVWKNGTVYEGGWHNGQPHGRGTLWVKKGKQLCKKYEGHFNHSKREGFGTAFFNNGERYEGEWLGGVKHGQGKYFYASGDVYEGSFVQGLRHGHGLYFHANSDVYQGEFADDAKHGSGTFFYTATKKRYDGLWVAGVAKCGVFGDLDPAGIPLPGLLALPNLELVDPMGVLDASASAAMTAYETAQQQQLESQQPPVMHPDDETLLEDIVGQEGDGSDPLAPEMTGDELPPTETA